MPTNQQPQQPPNKKKPFESYLKYSSLAFQIIAFIVLSLLIGLGLDKLFKSGFLFTLIFSVLGVIGAMVVTVKQVMNDNK